MAMILPDREIKKLIGTVLEDADEKFINPNGIQLRLGGSVRFLSTNEGKELLEDQYLRVSPGEHIIFSSLEKINFSKEAVQSIYPGCALMAFITPTTTMMREGISHASTKIDPGFHGVLNWGLQNNSTKDLSIGYGEPMFKLTIMKLDEREHPDALYGDFPEKDTYQNTDGIKRSSRQIPADIPEDKIVRSGLDKIDPKERLKGAGYPFNHISSELVEIQGDFKFISDEVEAIKRQFKKNSLEMEKKIENTSQELKQKIEENTSTLQESIKDMKENLTDKINSVFTQKVYTLLMGIVGVMVSLLPLASILGEDNIAKFGWIGVVAGTVIISVAVILASKK